jgi:hypothetical protein
MSRAEERRVAAMRWSGAAIGAGGSAVLLLVAAIVLARGDEVNALKALVAVWLAALPVLGIGALAGSLIAGVSRRRASGEQTAQAQAAADLPRRLESAATDTGEHADEEHAHVR